MSDQLDQKKREKKGFRVLLLIVILYVLAVVGIMVYINLEKSGYFGSDVADYEENLVIGENIPSLVGSDSVDDIETLENIEDELILEEELVMDSPDLDGVDEGIGVKENEATKAPVEENGSYIQNIDNTIADVPAKPRPDTELLEKEDSVLNTFDLKLEVEESDGVFGLILNKLGSFPAKIKSFFSSDDENQENITSKGIEESEVEESKGMVDSILETLRSFPSKIKSFWGSGDNTQAEMTSEELEKSEVEESGGVLNSILETLGAFPTKIKSFFGSEDDAQTEMTPEKLQKMEELEGELREMKGKFKFTTEDNGAIWIDHINKPSPYTENGFYIYIGFTPSGKAYFRTVIRYSGSEWIDMKGILLQRNTSDQAMIIEVLENYQRKEIKELNRKNEWIDMASTSENVELLNSITALDIIKLTFMGESVDVEWVLPEKDIIALQESLYYYSLLKEKELLQNS